MESTFKVQEKIVLLYKIKTVVFNIILNSYLCTVT